LTSRSPVVEVHVLDVLVAAVDVHMIAAFGGGA
jgi:hypothetical protein